MTKCSHDPKTTIGPIGMYHCPECGDMVIAGFDHPDIDEAMKNYDNYLDKKYELLKSYFKERLGQSTYESFVIFMDLKPNMKSSMMEIWLRANMENKKEPCTCRGCEFGI